MDRQQTIDKPQEYRYFAFVSYSRKDMPWAKWLQKKLQNYITENFYTCTNEILASLGQMYVADERFKNNIDKHSVGTTEFVSKAIEEFCK